MKKIVLSFVLLTSSVFASSEDIENYINCINALERSITTTDGISYTINEETLHRSLFALDERTEVITFDAADDNLANEPNEDLANFKVIEGISRIIGIDPESIKDSKALGVIKKHSPKVVRFLEEVLWNIDAYAENSSLDILRDAIGNTMFARQKKDRELQAKKNALMNIYMAIVSIRDSLTK